MSKKYQITINEKMAAGYPVASRMLETLSGTKRALTLLATCEAFAESENLISNDPETLYYCAMLRLKGVESQKDSPDVTEKSANISGDNSNNIYLAKINESIEQGGK